MKRLVVPFIVTVLIAYFVCLLIFPVKLVGIYFVISILSFIGLMIAAKFNSAYLAITVALATCVVCFWILGWYALWIGGVNLLIMKTIEIFWLRGMCYRA
jgi:hypothetical protein